MSRYLLTPFFLLFISTVSAQIDVRDYASEDLFAIKPVVSSDQTFGQKEEAPNSWVEKTYVRAIENIDSGKREDALADLDELIDYDSEVPVFHYLQGIVFMENGQSEEAKKKFNDALSASPYFLEANYMLGMLALEDGDEKKARDLFKGLTEISQYEALGYHGLGYEALEKGNSYGAKRDFRRCIEADSTFIDAYSTLATIEILTGNMRTGRKVLDSGIEEVPDWEEGIVMRAMLSLLIDEDMDSFQVDISRLIELSPENFHYLFLRVALLIEEDSWHEAILQYREACRLDTTSRKAFRFTSRISSEEDLISSIDYYLDNLPQNKDTRLALEEGLCEMIRNHDREAWSIIRNTNNEDPTSVGYLLEGVSAEKSFKGRDVIIEAYSNSIKRDTMNVQAYHKRGDLLVKGGQYEGAYLDFNRLVEINPRDKEVWKKRGIILSQMNYPEHAYRDFSIAIGLDSTDTELYFNRATVAYQLNNYAILEMDLTKLLAKEPEDGEAWYLYFSSRLAQGDTLDALVKLDSASAHLRFKTKVHSELLAMAKDLNRTDLEEEAHSRRIRSSRRQYEFLLERGKFYYHQNRFEEALKDLEQYVNRLENSGTGYYYLSKVYAELDETKKAERNLRKAEKFGYTTD